MVKHCRQSSPDGSVNPLVLVAKCTPTKTCEQNHIRHAPLFVQNGSQQGGLIGRFENERCERLPVRRRNARIGDRKRGAKHLGNPRSMRFLGVSDLHVAVHTDAQHAAQHIELVWKNSSRRWLPYSRSTLLCDSNASRSTGLVAASSPAGPTRASAAHENTVRSPRSMLKPVVLNNARHCSISSISPVGPVPGSRAAGEFETRSACWRQLAVVQYIPVGLLCLKRSGILSCPGRALGACRADHANRHHRCNNGSSESNHSRTPNDCGFRAEHSR